MFRDEGKNEATREEANNNIIYFKAIWIELIGKLYSSEENPFDPNKLLFLDARRGEIGRKKVGNNCREGVVDEVKPFACNLVIL